jgi:hypothetical protein
MLLVSRKLFNVVTLKFITANTHVHYTDYFMMGCCKHRLPSTHITMLCTCACLKCFWSTCFHTGHLNKFNSLSEFQNCWTQFNITLVLNYQTARKRLTGPHLRSHLFEHMERRQGQFLLLFFCTFWDLGLLNSVWHQTRTWFPWVSSWVWQMTWNG